LINSILTVGILEFYGAEGKFKALIDSYLTGRYQRVALDNITDNSNSSEWEKNKMRCTTRLNSWPSVLPNLH
jgi:hypothetical protein